MLSENIKRLRKSAGLTQEELATRLNVVRQTISKWEKGLSVPDSEMLIEISQLFDTPVSVLLGVTIEPQDEESTIDTISHKLSQINEQLAVTAERKRRIIRLLSIVGVSAVALYAVFQIAASIYTKSFVWFLQEQSIGVIGGADGPTSIFLASSGISDGTVSIMAALLILSVAGLCLSRRKK